EIESLITAGEQLFPDLRQMRLLRAYAGVRPLYAPEEIGGGPAAERAISRAHVVVDHAARDGVSNFVSIVGGKLTTYRLMAEQTADLVCRRLGVDAPCTTADEVLPGQGVDRSFYWLGDRLAEHEADGGGDAGLICECEYVTRPMLEAFLAERMPCSLDDVRRGTRLGMGPCQGAFCTFRAAGLMAEHGPMDRTDEPLVGFLAERYRGTRPIAWGRQLQELWLSTGIYWGVLGLDALAEPGPGAEPAAAVADGPG
ncbi:MAG TPA: (2Fe-2S)-binding protein, partial [Candidatus Limnocylindrales bacterium]